MWVYPRGVVLPGMVLIGGDLCKEEMGLVELMGRASPEVRGTSLQL